MTEQGESRVLVIYRCPKCGSDSLDRFPCVFSCHDGHNHGQVEREPVEYLPAARRVEVRDDRVR